MADDEVLARAGLAVMVAMVKADEVVLDAEIDAMVKASRVLPGEPLTEADARAAVEADEDAEHVVEVVAAVAEGLEVHERETLFNVALGIAAADGELADEEKLLLTAIGEVLGMDVLEALLALFDDDDLVVGEVADEELAWLADDEPGEE